MPSTTAPGISGVGANVTGYYTPSVPGQPGQTGTAGYGQPGQTGSAGYGSYTNIMQPFPGQPPSTTTGPAVMQPSFVAGGGVQTPGQPTGRSNTYAVDEPVTWNDPPTVKAKKVV